MKALLLALTGFFCFTLMDLSLKWLLASHSLLQVTFFNCLFAMLGLLIWIYPNVSVLKTRQPGVHLLRAAFVLTADLLAFYSYSEVPLAEAYTLILSMPLFTVAFSVLLGYEKAQLKQVSISFLGFFGIFLVLAPSFSNFEIAMLAALASAIVEAFGFLVITHHRKKEPPQVFAFYGLSLLVLMTGFLTAFSYQPMSMEQWFISAAGGFCYAAATALVVSAFHCGRPGAVSSMQYTQLLWGMLLAFLIWNELPSPLSMAGGAVIVIAGLSLLLHKQKRVIG